MLKSLSLIKKAYIAGFLDGDGSIYARAKPNDSYRFGYQISLSITLFQSKKSKDSFEEVCSLIGYGKMRERNDGILEYSIQKLDDIKDFIEIVKPFLILKRKQAELTLKIIELKKKIEKEEDFESLLSLVNAFGELNYSKKRIKRRLTP